MSSLKFEKKGIVTSNTEIELLNSNGSTNQLMDLERSSISKRKIISKSFILYVIKRFVFYFLVFLIAISITFFITHSIPGNPFIIVEGVPGNTPGAVEAYNQKMAKLYSEFWLDQPLIKQYFHFLERFFFHGDLGKAISPGYPTVASQVYPRIGLTLVIAIPGTIISFWVGNSIGALIGYRKKLSYNIIYYIAMILQAIPLFVLCFVIQWWVVLSKPFIIDYPTSGFNTPWNITKEYIVMLTTFVLVFSGGWGTGMRSMMIYEVDSDYLLYCRKLGFSDRKLRQYAKRNSMLPQFTGLNLRFNDMLSATFVTEYLFLWTGLGHTVWEAATTNNFNLLMGALIISFLVVTAGNFLIDCIYGFIDPRIKVGGIS